MSTFSISAWQRRINEFTERGIIRLDNELVERLQETDQDAWLEIVSPQVNDSDVADWAKAHKVACHELGDGMFFATDEKINNQLGTDEYFYSSSLESFGTPEESLRHAFEQSGDADGQRPEFYQYFVVHDYFGRLLESVGEYVVEIDGESVWCRQTCGQACSSDYCMEKAYRLDQLPRDVANYQTALGKWCELNAAIAVLEQALEPRFARVIELLKYERHTLEYYTLNQLPPTTAVVLV